MSGYDRLPEWAADHWVKLGLLTGVQAALLAGIVTWRPLIGVVVGVLFGAFNMWIWRPGGPAHRWRRAILRRYPSDPS